MTEEELIDQLNLIWFVSHESKNDSVPIGLLTTENRRTWASLRNHLLQSNTKTLLGHFRIVLLINAFLKIDTINQESLRNLETSRFIICLDDSIFVKSKCFRKNSLQCARREISFMAHQLIHGGGQEYNSGNRYYDKFLQVYSPTQSPGSVNNYIFCLILFRWLLVKMEFVELFLNIQPPKE